MTKKLIALISANDKTPEQLAGEAINAFKKYQESSQLKVLVQDIDGQNQKNASLVNLKGD
jgi:hypothetical protein